jgi:CheY-like chemotaxis protein
MAFRTELSVIVPHESISTAIPGYCMKFMIVDDNPKIRETIRKIVGTADDEFIEAEDGEEALKTYPLEKPDWVLMDIRMPVMDGIEAAGLLHTYFPESKIIIVTEYADERHRLAAMQAGAYGFVSKENLLDLKTVFRSFSHS